MRGLAAFRGQPRILQHVRPAEDGVERRAQLVRQRRQELVLHASRLFGFGARAPRLFGLLLRGLDQPRVVQQQRGPRRDRLDQPDLVVGVLDGPLDRPSASVPNTCPSLTSGHSTPRSRPEPLDGTAVDGLLDLPQHVRRHFADDQRARMVQQLLIRRIAGRKIGNVGERAEIALAFGHVVRVGHALDARAVDDTRSCRRRR